MTLTIHSSGRVSVLQQKGKIKQDSNPRGLRHSLGPETRFKHLCGDRKKKDLIWLQTKTDSESSPFGATTERRKCVSLFPEFFSSPCELTECKYESLESGREETHPKADESATLGWTGLGG